MVYFRLAKNKIAKKHSRKSVKRVQKKNNRTRVIQMDTPDYYRLMYFVSPKIIAVFLVFTSGGYVKLNDLRLVSPTFTSS